MRKGRCHVASQLTGAILKGQRVPREFWPALRPVDRQMWKLRREHQRYAQAIGRVRRFRRALPSNDPDIRFDQACAPPRSNCLSGIPMHSGKAQRETVPRIMSPHSEDSIGPRGRGGSTAALGLRTNFWTLNQGLRPRPAIVLARNIDPILELRGRGSNRNLAASAVRPPLRDPSA